MIDLVEKLPFWLAGTQARRLANAAKAFWSRAEGWLSQAQAQADIATCSSAALAAHAVDRDVTRLPNEPEALWRDRTLHALTVAIDSGSYLGLGYILNVHGVLYNDIQERVTGEDWDIIFVILQPFALHGADSELLDRIFHQWGRVCRRYVATYYETILVGRDARATDETQYAEIAA